MPGNRRALMQPVQQAMAPNGEEAARTDENYALFIQYRPVAQVEGMCQTMLGSPRVGA